MTRRVACSIRLSIDEKDRRSTLKRLTVDAARGLRAQGVEFIVTPWRPDVTAYHDVPDELEAARRVAPTQPYVVFAVPTTPDDRYADPQAPSVVLQHRYLHRRGRDVVVQVLRNVFGDRLVWYHPRSCCDIQIMW